MSGAFLTSSGPLGFLVSLPPTTKGLTAALLACSTLIQVARMTVSVHDLKSVFRGSVDDSLAFPWLVVVPGYAFFRPWTLVTAALTEAGLIELVFSLFTLIFAGRYLERVWGPLEFLKFCAATVVASNLMSIAVNVLEFLVLPDGGAFLYGMSYHGLMALQTGFLVAFTQLIPEHQVQLFGVFKLRVKKLPMLYVGFSNVMCIVGFQSPFILIQMGWLVAWFYLRFIKWSDGGEFRGDRSETFAFANWFPPFVQAPVKRISDIVFSIAVKAHILRGWGSDLESGAYSSVPGGARAEAERRRAMALKALDQRLASSKATPSASPTPATVGAKGPSAPNTPAAVPPPALPSQAKSSTAVPTLSSSQPASAAPPAPAPAPAAAAAKDGTVMGAEGDVFDAAGPGQQEKGKGKAED